MPAAKFNYRTIDEFKADINKLGLNIPFSDDVSVLRKPVKIGCRFAPNSIAIQPMEGCDSTLGGSPSELTFRRYKRFAAGQAGIIWVEATAVLKEGRANPRQLFICKDNLGAFQEIIHTIKNHSGSQSPYTILQLTHSGRYSRPVDKPAPMICTGNPYLDKPELEYSIITDEELEQIEEKFAEAAQLSKLAGFDAVDIKACHGYLINEFLSGFNRKGNYGGSFENRTRLLLNIVRKIRAKIKIDIAVRLNAFDEIPYAYGFGSDKKDFRKYDLNETKALVKLLISEGVSLINITGGNPYYNPHVGRPYDRGPYIAPESQLYHIEKMINAAREVKKEASGAVFVGSAMTWLREYAVNVGIAAIKERFFDIIGLGRQGIAYPDFPADIIASGKMSRIKCCITCGKCTELMRAGSAAGCVIRDKDIYAPMYKKAVKTPPVQNVYIQEHIY